MLRRATPEDLPLLRDLAVSIWWEHYPAIIGNDQVTYMLERGYSLDALQQQMRDGQQFFLIEVEGQSIGYIGVTIKEPGKMFINKFYINNQVRGKGVGAQAFEALLKFFPDVQEIRLQVNRRNFKSVNFYFKMGFIIEKSFDMPIGEGYIMDDYMMLKVCGI
ncbi:MAG: GNAT family N-acetyltransferase [Saprospiraceae bacterium]|nr:GNAT family N-acetyltransferase [Saprospiraceae bacterium]